MYGNSPVTVQLDAQVPWRVTHNSEPSMLAPIGAPAAALHILTQLFTHAFVRRCRVQHDRHYAWRSSVVNQELAAQHLQPV